MERYLFEFVLLVAVFAVPSNQFRLPPPPHHHISTPILPSTAIVPTITATILVPNSIIMPTPTSLPGNIISNIMYCKLFYDLVLMCYARRDRRWGFTWPNTPAGERARIPCPPNFRG